MTLGTSRTVKKNINQHKHRLEGHIKLNHSSIDDINLHSLRLINAFALGKKKVNQNNNQHKDLHSLEKHQVKLVHSNNQYMVAHPINQRHTNRTVF